MKKVFQKSGSLLMALLVLFSTVSFTVDKHFCGSILVDKAVFSEAKTCGMTTGDTGVAMGDMEDSCCTEEKVFVEGQDELKRSFGDFDFQQQLFLTSYLISRSALFEVPAEDFVPFKHYTPPLLVTEIQLLDQVFLI